MEAKTSEKEKTTWIKPEDVQSPKKNFRLIAVLDGGEEGGYALAIGKWDGEIVLVSRRNGKDDEPIGNPQSRGLPTWFKLPSKYNEAILTSGTLSAERLDLARFFIPDKKGEVWYGSNRED